MEHIPKYELILRGPKASFILGNLTKFACFLFKPVEAALGVTKLTKNYLDSKLPASVKWIVVMGCGYSYKGGSMLRSRCMAGAQVFFNHPDMSIIVSGADRPGHSETGFMKQRLIEYGVPEEKIICDGRGINTLATFQNFKAMLQNRGSSERDGLVEHEGTARRDVLTGHEGLVEHDDLVESDSLIKGDNLIECGGLVVCSNDFHIPRCVYTARKLGLEAYGTPNPPTPDPAHWRYWLREKAALCKYSHLLKRICSEKGSCDTES